MDTHWHIQVQNQAANYSKLLKVFFTEHCSVWLHLMKQFTYHQGNAIEVPWSRCPESPGKDGIPGCGSESLGIHGLSIRHVQESQPSRGAKAGRDPGSRGDSVPRSLRWGPKLGRIWPKRVTTTRGFGGHAVGAISIKWMPLMEGALGGPPTPGILGMMVRGPRPEICREMSWPNSFLGTLFGGQKLGTTGGTPCLHRRNQPQSEITRKIFGKATRKYWAKTSYSKRNS